jgi:NitT/TauT family transport system ATP-binding protein
MIEARNISKVFPPAVNGKNAPFSALDSVSLTIGEGAFISLLGPTGCGKSTLLEILAGLQQPTDGEVVIDGRPVLEPRPSGRHFLPASANSLFRNSSCHDIAMIFQDYAVFPWMTARQNVLFTLKLRGVPQAERSGLAGNYLRRVGLGDAENCYPSRMSGGMRQRLALARALAVEPRIILMDEPFAAVDALTRETLREELLSLWQSSGTTIVLVTHDVHEAVYLSDEIVVFSPSPGRIRSRIRVDLPRPRSYASAAVRDLTEALLGILRDGQVHRNI